MSPKEKKDLIYRNTCKLRDYKGYKSDRLREPYTNDMDKMQ